MQHRLLIADREAEWRELFERFLADWGYEVETSTDGLDCLAKLRDATPDLLVLDLELPWGGGDGVLAWLREDGSAPKIPVLLIGPDVAPPDLTEFNEPPIVGYLPKPVGLTRLLKSVRSTFASTEPMEETLEHRSRSSLFRALASSDDK
jgi:CheY-like chemotaxis protein